MKKIIILFSVLLVAFLGIWVFKTKTPINRPEDQRASDALDWWKVEIPEADPEWILDVEIPENYVPVPGEHEVYMVLDDSGNIVKYGSRTYNQESGEWLWSYTEATPGKVPQEYKAVPGLENVYIISDASGDRYVKYIRNDDGSYAFIEVDKDGKPIGQEVANDVIPDNYIYLGDNVYAVRNEHGVVIGYKERIKTAEGKYIWADVKKPENTPTAAPTAYLKPTSTAGLILTPAPTPISTPAPTAAATSQTVVTPAPHNDTYVMTERTTSTKIAGNYLITYETIVTKTYAANGDLLSTKKDGPNEISRTLLDSSSKEPNPALIEDTLQKEYNRVSKGMNYVADASKVLDLINADRKSSGLKPLTIKTDSDADLLAKTRAADMAIYAYADHDSAMYGTIGEMCSRFNITHVDIAEVVMRTPTDSPEKIASRLVIQSPELCATDAVKQVGFAIVSKGGYYYVDVLLFY